MVPPRNTTAEEGVRVRLECQAGGYPDNVSVHWSFDGVDVNDVEHLIQPTRRVHVLTDVEHLVQPTRRVHVLTDVEHLVQSTRRVHVLTDVEHLVQPTRRVHVLTDVEHLVQPTRRVHVLTDGALVIDDVNKDDSGWYKCRPSNRLGTAPEADAFLNVTCEYLSRLLARVVS